MNTPTDGKTIRELFVDSGLIDRLYFEQTPIDLFRFFETNGPLSDKMLMYPYLQPYAIPGTTNTRTPDVDRREIPAGSGQFFIFPHKKMALSLFDGPANFTKPGIHYVVPMGSGIPCGLAISKDNRSKLGRTHYSVHPQIVMHELHYLFLLRRFATNAIQIDAWKALYPERAKTFNL